MSKAFFIAGTDTDVGKTVVSKAILQGLVKGGHKTVGFKPIAAGCETTPEGNRNDDALHLQTDSSVEVPYELVNPIALTAPASPHIAADIDDVAIDVSVLDESLAKLKSKADYVLVEGAGGWRVPMTLEQSLSTWVEKHQLPVVLVVGVKLGCLNHALLTAEAISNDGVKLIGWVANCVDADMPHYQENIAFLKANLPAPLLGEIPRLIDPNSVDLSGFIDISSIVKL